MKQWQKNALMFVAGFVLVYLWRSARAESSGNKWNGYAVSEQQKAMLDAQDAAFSASMDYTSGPFVPFVVDYSLRG